MISFYHSLRSLLDARGYQDVLPLEATPLVHALLRDILILLKFIRTFRPCCCCAYCNCPSLLELKKPKAPAEWVSIPEPGTIMSRLYPASPCGDPEFTRLQNLLLYSASKDPCCPPCPDADTRRYLQFQKDCTEALHIQLRKLKSSGKEADAALIQLLKLLEAKDLEIEKLRPIAEGKDGETELALKNALLQVDILLKRNRVLEERVGTRLAATFPAFETSKLMDKVLELELALQACCKEKAALRSRLERCDGDSSGAETGPFSVAESDSSFGGDGLGVEGVETPTKLSKADVNVSGSGSGTEMPRSSGSGSQKKGSGFGLMRKSQDASLPRKSSSGEKRSSVPGAKRPSTESTSTGYPSSEDKRKSSGTATASTRTSKDSNYRSSGEQKRASGSGGPFVKKPFGGSGSSVSPIRPPQTNIFETSETESTLQTTTASTKDQERAGSTVDFIAKALVNILGGTSASEGTTDQSAATGKTRTSKEDRTGASEVEILNLQIQEEDTTKESEESDKARFMKRKSSSDTKVQKRDSDMSKLSEKKSSSDTATAQAQSKRDSSDKSKLSEKKSSSDTTIAETRLRVESNNSDTTITQGQPKRDSSVRSKLSEKKLSSDTTIAETRLRVESNKNDAAITQAQQNRDSSDRSKLSEKKSSSDTTIAETRLRVESNNSDTTTTQGQPKRDSSDRSKLSEKKSSRDTTIAETRLRVDSEGTKTKESTQKKPFTQSRVPPESTRKSSDSDEETIIHQTHRVHTERRRSMTDSEPHSSHSHSHHKKAAHHPSRPEPIDENEENEDDEDDEQEQEPQITVTMSIPLHMSGHGHTGHPGHSKHQHAKFVRRLSQDEDIEIEDDEIIEEIHEHGHHGHQQKQKTKYAKSVGHLQPPPGSTHVPPGATPSLYRTAEKFADGISEDSELLSKIYPAAESVNQQQPPPGSSYGQSSATATPSLFRTDEKFNQSRVPPESSRKSSDSDEETIIHQTHSVHTERRRSMTNSESHSSHEEEAHEGEDQGGGPEDYKHVGFFRVDTRPFDPYRSRAERNVRKKGIIPPSGSEGDFWNALEKERQTEKEQLRQANERGMERISELTKEVAGLRSENNFLKSSIGSSRRDLEQISQLERNIRKLNDTNDSLRQELDSKDERLHKLQSHTRNLEEEVSRLRSLLKRQSESTDFSLRTERDMALMKRVNEGMSFDLDKLRRQRDEAVSDSTKLASALKNMEQERSEWARDTEKKSREIVELKRLVAEYVEEVRRIEEIVNEKEELLQALITQYTEEFPPQTAPKMNYERPLLSLQLRQDSSSSSASASVVAERTSSYEAEIEKLTGQVVHLQVELTKLSEKSERSAKELKAKTELVTQLENKIDELRLQSGEKDGNLMKYQSQIRDMQSHIDNLSKTIEQLDSKEKHLQEQLSLLKEKETQHAKTVDEVSKEKADLLKKLDELSHETSSSISSLRLRVRQLELELDRTKRQLQSEKLEREGAISELRRLQQQLNDSTTNSLLNQALLSSSGRDLDSARESGNEGDL